MPGPSGPPSPEEQLRNIQAVAEHLHGEALRRNAAPRPAAGAPHGHGAGRAAGLGTIGVVAFFLLTKGKAFLALGKFLPSAASMLFTMAVYAREWGWPYAAGFVLLIMVHEMGHFIEMKRQGIPAGVPVFIPFVGAVIAMKGMPRNAYVEARVGIAGPLLGSAAAIALLPLGAVHPLVAALAVTGIAINLFNLIPLSPLDGGRIAGAISPWTWVFGLLVGGVFFLLTRSGLVLVLLVLGVITAYRRWRFPIPGYDRIPLLQRAGMGAAYLLLVGLLGGLLVLFAGAGREALAGAAAWLLASLGHRASGTGWTCGHGRVRPAVVGPTLVSRF